MSNQCGLASLIILLFLFYLGGWNICKMLFNGCHISSFVNFWTMCGNGRLEPMKPTNGLGSDKGLPVWLAWITNLTWCNSVGLGQETRAIQLDSNPNGTLNIFVHFYNYVSTYKRNYLSTQPTKSNPLNLTRVDITIHNTSIEFVNPTNPTRPDASKVELILNVT